MYIRFLRKVQCDPKNISSNTSVWGQWKTPPNSSMQFRKSKQNLHIHVSILSNWRIAWTLHHAQYNRREASPSYKPRQIGFLYGLGFNQRAEVVRLFCPERSLVHWNMHSRVETRCVTSMLKGRSTWYKEWPGRLLFPSIWMISHSVMPCKVRQLSLPFPWLK